MSANYSLTLQNPNVSGLNSNIVYTGQPNGNPLELIIGNNFGFDMTIGGNSYGKFLQVLIGSNILDDTGAGKLAVTGPWTMASHTGPTSTSAFYTFNLLPPAGGVVITNGQSITVTLQDVLPSAVGTGQVAVYYQFDQTPSDDLKASATLSSLAPPNPNLPPLVGDNQALRLTTYVNNGALANPIMVSTSSAPGQAADNSLHFNLLFQTATLTISQNAGNSVLVPSWNPKNPPAFRIYFPYFSDSDNLPAPLDLTDSRQPGDPNYDAVTSAWNIVGTLDPTNPNIKQNTFWQIGLDPQSKSIPVWLITPTAANTNLFTSVESSSSEPGPFLDLFLQQIVSVLPIDPRHPETILYFQWNNFPGFNDGIVTFPLQKVELAITCFTGSVIRNNQGATLNLQWSTTADHCLLSCDTNQHGPVAPSTNPYTKAISAAQPLQSSYTLTAVGTTGVQVTKTLNVKWSVNNSLTATKVGVAVSVQATADGTKVLVLSNSTNDVRFYDPHTLQPMHLPPLVPSDYSGASAFAIAPNSTNVYVVSSAGALFGWNIQTQQSLPGSGVSLAKSPMAPFLIGVSTDNTLVNVVTQANQGAGANQMNLFSSYNLQPSGSPIPLNDVPSGFLVAPQSGNYYVGLPKQLQVFNPSSLSQVSGSPLKLTNAFILGVSTDEKVAFALGLTGSPAMFALTLLNPATLQVIRQLPFGLGYNAQNLHFLGQPNAALEVSFDDAILFFIGQDENAIVNKQAPYRFSAFNAQTLEELPWSPIQFNNFLPVDLAMAPDGSRLYVLANLDGSGNPETSLYAVDPSLV